MQVATCYCYWFQTKQNEKIEDRTAAKRLNKKATCNTTHIFNSKDPLQNITRPQLNCFTRQNNNVKAVTITELTQIFYLRSKKEIKYRDRKNQNENSKQYPCCDFKRVR